MHAMHETMAVVDLYVSSGQDLAITNLTGHPSVVFPMGFRDRDGRALPGSIVLTGRLYDESTLLAVARAFQQATGDHLKRPPIERYLAAGVFKLPSAIPGPRHLIRVTRNDFATSHCSKRTPGYSGDRVLHESNASVAE